MFDSDNESNASGLSDKEEGQAVEAERDSQRQVSTEGPPPPVNFKRRASLEDVLKMTQAMFGSLDAPRGTESPQRMSRQASNASSLRPGSNSSSQRPGSSGDATRQTSKGSNARKLSLVEEADIFTISSVYGSEPLPKAMGRRRSCTDLGDPAYLSKIPDILRARRGSCADLGPRMGTPPDMSKRRGSVGTIQPVEKPEDVPQRQVSDPAQKQRRGSKGEGGLACLDQLVPEKRKGSKRKPSKKKAPPPQVEELSPQELEEQALDNLRAHLIKMHGTAAEAYKALDFSGSGLLEFEDFEATLADWDINFQQVSSGTVDLKRMFSLLDIDGSGVLSISELMEISPWRAEDEAVLLLRQHLLQCFGSKKGVLEALDINKDGSLSFKELKEGLVANDVDISEACGGVELRRMFDLLDHDLSHSLSLHELMDADPRKETQFRDKVVTNLRQGLLMHFGSNERLTSELDTQQTGQLKLAELKEGFQRCDFDFKTPLSGSSLAWIFKVLDTDQSGSLSIPELMLQDPVAASKKHGIERAERFKKRKEENVTKASAKAKIEAENPLPDITPRPVESLSPALQKIALFGTVGSQWGVSEKRDALIAAQWGVSSPAADRNLPPIELAVLDLTQCFIEQKGAARLAHALREPRMKKLEVLQLAGNYIGSEGLKWLVSSLQKHSSLRVLGLAWNLVDDEGAKTLATMARKLRSLMELDLRFNRIGDDGAEQLAKLLTSKAKFTRLDLGSNQVETKGCKDLQEAALKNKVKVILGGNLGFKRTVLAYRGHAVAGKPFGGMMLPQIKGVVVAGWPRSSTYDRKQGKSNNDASLPKPWAASQELSRSLSEAALIGLGQSRTWSRDASTSRTLSRDASIRRT